MSFKLTLRLLQNRHADKSLIGFLTIQGKSITLEPESCERLAHVWACHWDWLAGQFLGAKAHDLYVCNVAEAQKLFRKDRDITKLNARKARIFGALVGKSALQIRRLL